MNKSYSILSLLVFSMQAHGDLEIIGEFDSTYTNARTESVISVTERRLIKDTTSDLFWYDYSFPGEIWGDQKSTIESLELNYQDISNNEWRLPTCQEMHDLLFTELGFSEGETVPLNPEPEYPFQDINVSGATYWSNDLQDDNHVCMFNFSDGSEQPIHQGVMYAQGLAVHSIPNRGVVLLLDTSGSMSNTFEGDYTEILNLTRIFHVQRSTEAFMDQLLFFGENISQFGLIHFPPDAISGCTSELLLEMRDVTPENRNAAVQTINDLGSAGPTPMIAGLEQAATILNESDPKAVILLSDGYHNCPSRVQVNSTTYDELIDTLGDVKVYAIAFAPPDETDTQFLNEMAIATGGDFYDVSVHDPRTFDPQTALMSIFNKALKEGLGLQEVVEPNGVIRGDKIITRQVAITRHEQRISFFLGWAIPQKQRLDISVKSSDGELVEPSSYPGVRVYQGSNYKILAVDNRFLELTNKVTRAPWTVEIRPKKLTVEEQEHYHYSILAESTMRLITEFDKPRYETGDGIKVTARISPDPPSKSEKLKSVQVEVTRPAEGMGNWFASSKVTAEQLVKMPVGAGKEKLLPIQRKGLFLRQVQKKPFPGRSATITLDMFDDGTHGDLKARDGIYTTKYSDTTKEGTYSFLVRVSGLTADGNIFEREEMIQSYISVNISPSHTTVSANAIGIDTKSERYEITITPRDAFGNFLGPMHSDAISINVSKGRLAGQLKDNLDGTYSQVLTLPKKVDVHGVNLNISLSNKNVFANLEKIMEK